MYFFNNWENTDKELQKIRKLYETRVFKMT